MRPLRILIALKIFLLHVILIFLWRFLGYSTLMSKDFASCFLFRNWRKFCLLLNSNTFWRGALLILFTHKTWFLNDFLMLFTNRFGDTNFSFFISILVLVRRIWRCSSSGNMLRIWIIFLSNFLRSLRICYLFSFVLYLCAIT